MLDEDEWNSQLKQCQVGIDVNRSILTLLCDVFLENSHRFGIITIKSVQNSINVLRPIRRVVVWNPHVFMRLEAAVVVFFAEILQIFS